MTSRSHVELGGRHSPPRIVPFGTRSHPPVGPLVALCEVQETENDRFLCGLMTSLIFCPLSQTELH